MGALTPFQTALLLQGAIELTDQMSAILILRGQLDADLRTLIVYSNRVKLHPTSLALKALEQEQWVTDKLMELKLTIVNQVERAREQALEDQRQQNVDLKAELKALVAKAWQLKQAPHELGTVDEISKRHGISKSQVRRLKAEGGTALADYIDNLKNSQQGEASTNLD